MSEVFSEPTPIIESAPAPPPEEPGGGSGGSGGGNPGGSGGSGGPNFSALSGASHWNMRLFDRFGNAVSANYSGYSDFGTTNEIVHATNKNLGFYLNSLDTCEFSVYLDDPMAAHIKRLETFVKVWRTVPGYSDPPEHPCFAGPVYYHDKQGAANIMNVKAISPLWILQLRFHLLNHYLKTNPDTGQLYKQSETIWRLIDFISNAFGPIVSQTGIQKGTFYDVSEEVVMAPYFQPKGANVWTEIFDGILARAGSVDIIPRYFHSPGSGTLMYLDTALKRGADISNTTSFEFNTTTPSNLDDCVETEFVQPGKFGNYVWAVGGGGPNSGKIATAQNSSNTGEGYWAIGIYMVRKDYPDVKRIGILGANPPKTATHLRANALNDLARAIVPDTTYSVDISPASTMFYKKDFVIGDVISLNASKGALNISGLKQRVYEATLNLSDNNIEKVNAAISKDFTGKVAEGE